MSYTPVIPLSGMAGWRFLQRTEPVQRAAFETDAQLTRETEYFRANIAAVKTVDDLMNDRTLLKVALGAFELGDDLGKGAWVRKILEEGTDEASALAMRLTDRRYREFSATMGFGNETGARTGVTGFAEDLIRRYKDNEFTAAVGDVDNSMRLAMNYAGDMAELARRKLSNDAAWFTLMGNKPLRTVMEQALGLPDKLAALDVDKQLAFFKDKARSVFGTDDLASLAGGEETDRAIRIYLARAQIAAGPSGTSPASSALTLLRGGGASGGTLSSAGLASLILSRG